MTTDVVDCGVKAPKTGFERRTGPELGMPLSCDIKSHHVKPSSNRSGLRQEPQIPKPSYRPLLDDVCEVLENCCFVRCGSGGVCPRAQPRRATVPRHLLSQQFHWCPICDFFKGVVTETGPGAWAAFAPEISLSAGLVST